jgi:hypothetical protein
MTYQLVNEGTKNSMRLQSVGIVLGTPAGEITEGDFLMWNFGSVYSVNKIIKETPKTILIETSPKGSDKVYEQRLKKTRLVCKLEA